MSLVQHPYVTGPEGTVVGTSVVFCLGPWSGRYGHVTDVRPAEGAFTVRFRVGDGDLHEYDDVALLPVTETTTAAAS